MASADHLPEPLHGPADTNDDLARLSLFAERLFARLSREAAARLPVRERDEIARSAFEFIATRSEPIKARVSTRGEGDDAVAVIETLMDDCPFIVDSVREYLRQLGLPLGMLLHPVLAIGRDAGGRIDSFGASRSGERNESFIHAELDAVPAPATVQAIADELARRLEEVRLATSDFDTMTARALAICDEMAPTRELIEIRECLRWLVGGGFLFLGYRRYVLQAEDGRHSLAVDPGSGLGILRSEERSRFFAPREIDSLEPAQRKLMFEGPMLIVAKGRSISHVHRLRMMDDVAIRRVDERGRTAGFDRFIGLLTSKAHAEEAQHIPVLRSKLHELLEADRAMPGSHDFKALQDAFNSFPKEELFRATAAELRTQLDLILDVTNEESVRLGLISDVNRGCVIALVVMPRERLSFEMRVAIQDAIARRLGGAPVYFHIARREGYTTSLHFCFNAPPPDVNANRELEDEIARMTRGWDDRLRDLLIERKGEAHGHALSRRWFKAFSGDYKASTPVERAATDIERIEAMVEGDAQTVEIASASDGAATELRMYEVGESPALSDLMPLLQNFGIRVISEDAHELSPESGGRGQRAFVQLFRVEGPRGQPLEAMRGVERLAAALGAARSGLAENDPLNALTLEADLGWREVALLRAYLAAAFQMKLAPARPALRRVFIANPQLARILFDLFVTRLDPNAESPVERIAQLKAAYIDQLAAVENIADDRTARAVLAMIEATVRTNYFSPTPVGDPYITLKFESALIPDLPDTPPLYEIHVNSPRMEGCHLRAGRVARGGIRFSDRPDDYRTEILGLMKTQTVKNAIIVPVGSKGGFIVKAQPGASIAPERAAEAYRTLINAMLDLTDNLAGGETVHPPSVKVLDSDGPYLVVAADKGTAAFSDLANEIAESRGFWLGDAFASGGKHGYDHKQLGITARGAWESARRHLREMGRDIERGAPITMVGIGDMSGDVFGNGLLRSANVKLIAAFDHRHIFIDPTPDPQTSFAERKRLFEIQHSQWSDYNPASISAGGGVWPRGQKRIVLSEAVRAALKCTDETPDGESLVRTILRAEVDLLYNGGIGTYVRASDEIDAQVGDHANDTCRVAANELRARVVVEGGNLGFTQKARIEYALSGGRINTDAIDNSAGVDMSDHEVNLKILMQPAVARGAVGGTRRNRLLEEAAPEVAEQVLSDNRDQVLLLSLEQIRSRTQVSLFRDLLTAIEQHGWLRRHEEALPTREALSQRRTRFPGLARPELAVLAAYTKIDLARQLEASGLVDDAYLVERFLRPYFPRSIADQFAGDLTRHPLRRELIATELTNQLIDLMGSTFVFGLGRDYAAETEDVVRGWVIASDLLDLQAHVAQLAAAHPDLPAAADLDALFVLERAASRATRWALFAAPGEIGTVVAKFRDGLGALLGEFESMLAAGERERFETIYRELRTAGHREEPAHRLARTAFCGHLLQVLSLGFELGVSRDEAARVYFGLAAEIDFPLIEAGLEAVGATDDRWERRAAQELGIELESIRLQLTRAAIAGSSSDQFHDAVPALLHSRERRFNDVRQLLAELKMTSPISLPVIQVAMRALARLAS